jgi:hypothetical protein
VQLKMHSVTQMIVGKGPSAFNVRFQCDFLFSISFLVSRI